MPDWRALCAELASKLREYDSANPYRDCAALLARADAALASEPQGEGLSDNEIESIARAAEIQNMKQQGGLHANDANGIQAQLQAQRIAGLRAVCNAALAQPQGEGTPTVMEIIELADEIEAAELGQVDLVRAALARWGRPAAPPADLLERQQQMEDLAADAVSGLRYIEQQHGRLYGVGFDRIYEKADRLQPAHALPLPTITTTETTDD